MKFEQALDGLQKIVDKMESGDVTLDESVKLYEKGIALCGECAKQLNDVRGKITQIGFDADGNVTQTPFETAEQA